MEPERFVVALGLRGRGGVWQQGGGEERGVTANGHGFFSWW